MFLKSDPIWQKIFPPWEFNCNCWVENSDKTPSGGISAAQIQPPASGYQFDPSDAFEDYKVDNYDFDHPIRRRFSGRESRQNSSNARS